MFELSMRNGINKIKLFLSITVIVIFLVIRIISTSIKNPIDIFTIPPESIASNVTQYQILWGRLSASGVIAMAPVLIFAFLVQKHLVRGMSMGAIKG